MHLWSVQQYKVLFIWHFQQQRISEKLKSWSTFDYSEQNIFYFWTENLFQPLLMNKWSLGATISWEKYSPSSKIHNDSSQKNSEYKNFAFTSNEYEFRFLHCENIFQLTYQKMRFSLFVSNTSRLVLQR